MNKENLELLKNKIETINKTKKAPSAVGSKSKCYLFKGVAVLKSKEPVSPQELFKDFNSFSTLESFNNYLIKLGFPTCKTFAYCFAKSGRYFELQERIYGRPLFRFNTEKLLKELNLQFNPEVDLSKLPPMFKYKIAENVVAYNTKTQRLLNTAPQKHFDDLLKGIVAVNNVGITSFDNNAENLLYSRKNGFRIVDPCLAEMFVEHNKNKNTSFVPDADTALCNMIDYFSDSLCFSDFEKAVLSPEQVEELQFGNVRIAKKIITAADNNNIDIKQGSLAMSELTSLVGNKNLQKYMDFLFFNQKALNKKELK